VAQRGVEVYLYFSKTPAIEGGERSAARPGRTFPPGKDPVPVVREAVCVICMSCFIVSKCTVKGLLF